MKNICLVALSTMVWCSSASSSEIENYFTAEPYVCGIIYQRSQLAVISGADETVAIQYYISNNGFPKFREYSWTFTREELASPVDLVNGNFKARLTDGLTENPQYEALNFSGNVATDCQAVLQKAQSPETRLDNVKKLLSITQPASADAVAVNKQYPELPPAQLLPAFEKGQNSKDIERNHKAFFDRYEQHVLEMASDISNLEVLPGLETAWLAQVKAKKKWHGDLLIKAQRKRAGALIAANKDSDKSSLRPADLCKRIDGMVSRWNLYPYIELSTGIPTALWQQDEFEEQVNSASECENSDYFSKSLQKYWQNSEKVIAAVGRLRDKRDALLATPLEPEILAENAWFARDKQLVNDSIRARVTKPTLNAFYLDPLEKKRQKIPEAIPKALAAKAVESNLELSKFSNYCKTELAVGGRANKLQAKTMNNCTALFSDLFFKQSLSEIEREKELWLSKPANKETLFAAKAEGIYKVAAHSFDSIESKLSHALGNANEEVNKHLSGVAEETQRELKQAYEEADVQSGKREKLDSLCGEISAAQKNSHVQSLNSICELHDRNFDNQVFFAKSIEQIQAEKEKWLALPANREELFKAGDEGISIPIPEKYRNVKGKLNVAMKAANEEIARHFTVAFQDTQKEIDRAYQEADFQSGEKGRLDELCKEVYAAVKNQAVKVLSAQCDVHNRNFEIEQAKQGCSVLWSEVDSSAELSSVELPLADGQLLPLREIYCHYKDLGEDITISSQETGSSLEYSISRMRIIENTPVVFTVRLNAPPSAEHNWYLGSGKMEPDLFDAERFISHNALLQCLDSPERCVRR